MQCNTQQYHLSFITLKLHDMNHVDQGAKSRNCYLHSFTELTAKSKRWFREEQKESIGMQNLSGFHEVHYIQTR